MTFQVPNQFRILTGYAASNDSIGNNGAFFVRIRTGQPPLRVIASDQAMPGDPVAWEHVSVSLPDRCPTWAEMCAVKDLFWSAEDCVVQYHPPASEYVNAHPFCLHLWRPVGVTIPTPPSVMVGPRTADATP